MSELRLHDSAYPPMRAEEVAAMLNVSVGRVYALASAGSAAGQGLAPHWRYGGRKGLRWRREDVERWLVSKVASVEKEPKAKKFVRIDISKIRRAA